MTQSLSDRITFPTSQGYLGFPSDDGDISRLLKMIDTDARSESSSHSMQLLHCSFFNASFAVRGRSSDDQPIETTKTDEKSDRSDQQNGRPVLNEAATESANLAGSLFFSLHCQSLKGAFLAITNAKLAKCGSCLFNISAATCRTEAARFPSTSFRSTSLGETDVRHTRACELL